MLYTWIHIQKCFSMMIMLYLLTNNSVKNIYFSVCMLHTWIHIQKYFNMMIILFFVDAIFLMK